MRLSSLSGFLRRRRRVILASLAAAVAVAVAGTFLAGYATYRKVVGEVHHVTVSDLGKRPPVYVQELAPWSAVRNAAHAYGFAAFTVDPGSHPGDLTTINVTYYDVVGPDGRLAAFETFTLRRPRRD